VVDFLLASIVKASILVFYQLDGAIPMNVGAYGSVVIAAAGKYGIFCRDEKVGHAHRA
jgi:hypothetical protein